MNAWRFRRFLMHQNLCEERKMKKSIDRQYPFLSNSTNRVIKGGSGIVVRGRQQVLSRYEINRRLAR